MKEKNLNMKSIYIFDSERRISNEVIILSDMKEKRGKGESVYDEKQGIIAFANPHLCVKNQLEVFKNIYDS